MKNLKETYGLIWKLSSINGSRVCGKLLDRVMYNFEALPPLGKEYWWFLFFGQDRKQMMLTVFRKFGKNMVFNGRRAVFRKISENVFQAVTAGWVYDGNKIHDLGDTNPEIMVNSKKKTIISNISNRKMTFKGGFPEYELEIDEIVHLKMKKGDFPENKYAHGALIPPFGAGWVDIHSNAEGSVLGERFNGTAHLQKVVGIMTYGPFHWGRVVFKDGSATSIFCLKTGRDSKRYFHQSMIFYDHKTKRYLRFKKPKLRILKWEREKNDMWTVEGQDEDKKLRVVLEAYAKKEFTMRGGGRQVYIEYAVTPREFNLKTQDKIITLEDLGEGVGTFEDAHGSPI